jgi:hypothetical protein
MSIFSLSPWCSISLKCASISRLSALADVRARIGLPEELPPCHQNTGNGMRGGGESSEVRGNSCL